MGLLVLAEERGLLERAGGLGEADCGVLDRVDVLDGPLLGRRLSLVEVAEGVVGEQREETFGPRSFDEVMASNIFWGHIGSVDC